jgi:hypothetical protein
MVIGATLVIILTQCEPLEPVYALRFGFSLCCGLFGSVLNPALVVFEAGSK